ncbi:MAG: hypothetical protein ACJAQU_001707 [Loktanella salsilacus]|jgi:hypothetical protein
MRALIQISSHAKSAAGQLFGNQQIAAIRSHLQLSGKPTE